MEKLIIYILYHTNMAKITITFAPEFVKRHMNSEIDKEADYICLYQKRTRHDGDDEEVYNLGLYKQVGGYIIGQSGLNEVLNFLKKKGNVQFNELDPLIKDS